MDPIDCIIIGAGPAGLAAALYLARYRRNFSIFDAGYSRLTRIPLSHNYPGYPQGIPGKMLLEKLRKQFAAYCVPVIEETVLSLEKTCDGKFIVHSQNWKKTASTVLLATGVEDIEPILPDLENAIARGLIRHCPVCDAYEIINRKVGVIGHGKSGLEEALFLRDYTPTLFLITLGKISDWKEKEAEEIRKANIRVIDAKVEKISIDSNKVDITFENGKGLLLDCLYSALGSNNKNSLIANMPVTLRKGLMVVDKDQQTSLQGLYAAGDIVSSLHQICVAQSGAAIAATAIHNRLRQFTLK